MVCWKLPVSYGPADPTEVRNIDTLWRLVKISSSIWRISSCRYRDAVKIAVVATVKAISTPVLRVSCVRNEVACHRRATHCDGFGLAIQRLSCVLKRYPTPHFDWLDVG